MAAKPLVAVLDVCVLFPFTLRDTLLRAAADDLFQVRWSGEILDEMGQRNPGIREPQSGQPPTTRVNGPS